MLLLAPSLPRPMEEDYRWMCERFLEEEIHFRRTGAYRLSTFEEAAREVYDDPEVMSRYMGGLLLSQVIWLNHANVSQYFVEGFLPGLKDGYRHVEIGPGHGLNLFFAANDPRCAELTALDVSDTSLEATRRSLDELGVKREVRLDKRSVLDPLTGSPTYDSIVISEVLEHLETPDVALRNLRALLEPGADACSSTSRSPAPPPTTSTCGRNPRTSCSWSRAPASRSSTNASCP